MIDRVAVVTGAGSGIGAATSKELAARGFLVIPTDIDGVSADRIAQMCGSPASYRLDVTDAEDVRATVESIVNAHGTPTVWVSNAGISKMQRFLEISAEDFDQTIGVNLRGLFLTSQAATRAMATSGNGGCIVNIASMAGKQGRVPFLADYVASKFGVVGLTQAMAYELAQHNIRVNSVCPGYVATAMQNRELEWEAGLRGVSADDVRKIYIADTPMKRLEEAEDVAKVVAFLASDDAAFITGESIAVNGGAFMD